MKYTILILFLALSVSTVFSSSTSIPVEHINRYDKTPENALRVPTNFAQEFILTPAMLKTLEGKRIHHVDLVYTAFRQSPTFDQAALNNDRIEELQTLLPQVETDEPSWRFIEQEGAKSVHSARGYFHGFVIHYSDELTYPELDAFYRPFQVEFTEYIGNNVRKNVFNHPTKTIITVHQDAVIDKEGTLVEGDYIVKYREFRNSADVVYSGIPMNYVDGGVSYNFSSVGMYEIRAEQNGKILSLTKPAVIDFNCTRTDSDVDFYQMNDETGDWKQIHTVNFPKPREAALGGVKMVREAPIDEQNLTFPKFNDDRWSWSARSVDSSNVEMKFARTSWRRVQTSLKRDEFWQDKLVKSSSTHRTIVIDSKDSLRFSNLIEKAKFLWWAPVFVKALVNHKRVEGKWKAVKRNNEPVEPAGTLLAEGADAGHTYPTLVRGLNSPEFGVYNCDQIYRLGNTARLAPNYVDEKTGKSITGKHVACVLDLNYQGAFSFHPNNITCNMTGKNVVLLFTDDHKTYMIENDDIKSAYDVNKLSPKFVMKDMSETLKSTDDLKELLSL